MIVPSAGNRTCRAVRRDADAVDACAADDRDSPAAVGAGAQHGERVVADVQTLRPRTRLERGLQQPLLLREVDAGEEHLRDGRALAVEARVADKACQQLD